MKTQSNTRQSVREAAVYVLAYALWLVTMVMAILAVLEIRVAVNALWVIGGGDHYSTALVDQACLLVVGLIAFIYVMWLEHDYREGVRLRLSPHLDDKVPPVPQRRAMHWLAERGMDLLARRFAITFAIPLMLFLLSLVIYTGAVEAMTRVLG